MSDKILEYHIVDIENSIAQFANNTLFFIKFCLPMLPNQLAGCTRAEKLFGYQTNKSKSEAFV